MTIEERFERIEHITAGLAEESRDADRRLGERIDSLVSAMGEFLRQGRRE